METQNQFQLLLRKLSRESSFGSEGTSGRFSNGICVYIGKRAVEKIGGTLPDLLGDTLCIEPAQIKKKIRSACICEMEDFADTGAKIRGEISGFIEDGQIDPYGENTIKISFFSFVGDPIFDAYPEDLLRELNGIERELASKGIGTVSDFYGIFDLNESIDEKDGAVMLREKNLRRVLTEFCDGTDRRFVFHLPRLFGQMDYFPILKSIAMMVLLRLGGLVALTGREGRGRENCYDWYTFFLFEEDIPSFVTCKTLLWMLREQGKVESRFEASLAGQLDRKIGEELKKLEEVLYADIDAEDIEFAPISVSVSESVRTGSKRGFFSRITGSPPQPDRLTITDDSVERMIGSLLAEQMNAYENKKKLIFDEAKKQDILECLMNLCTSLSQLEELRWRLEAGLEGTECKMDLSSDRTADHTCFVNKNEIYRRRFQLMKKEKRDVLKSELYEAYIGNRELLERRIRENQTKIRGEAEAAAVDIPGFRETELYAALVKQPPTLMSDEQEMLNCIDYAQMHRAIKENLLVSEILKAAFPQVKKRAQVVRTFGGMPIETRESYCLYIDETDADLTGPVRVPEGMQKKVGSVFHKEIISVMFLSYQNDGQCDLLPYAENRQEGRGL